MPRLPKYNSSRLFHKLAQEVKKDFIERNGRKPTIPEWNEIQKFTSKNIFPQYRGSSHKKVDVKEVQKNIKFITAPKKREQCGNVFNVNQADYEFVEWWNVYNIIEGLPKDVKIRVNGGDFYGRSKIDQVYTFDYYEDIQDVFEKIRVAARNQSDPNVFFEGVIKVVPDGKDDGKPCSYFLDFILNDGDGRVDVSDSLEVVSEATAKDRERVKRLKAAEIKQKLSKAEKIKKAKSRQRPSKTEEQAKEAEGKKYSDNKLKAIQLMTEALSLLRKDFESGIYTAKEYKLEREKLLNKFENGGQI